MLFSLIFEWCLNCSVLCKTLKWNSNRHYIRSITVQYTKDCCQRFIFTYFLCWALRLLHCHMVFVMKLVLSFLILNLEMKIWHCIPLASVDLILGRNKLFYENQECWTWFISQRGKSVCTVILMWSVLRSTIKRLQVVSCIVRRWVTTWLSRIIMQAQCQWDLVI